MPSSLAIFVADAIWARAGLLRPFTTLWAIASSTLLATLEANAFSSVSSRILANCTASRSSVLPHTGSSILSFRSCADKDIVGMGCVSLGRIAGEAKGMAIYSLFTMA